MLDRKRSIEIHTRRMVSPSRTLALYLLHDAISRINYVKEAGWFDLANPRYLFWCASADVEPLALLKRALEVAEEEHCHTSVAVLEDTLARCQMQGSTPHLNAGYSPAFECRAQPSIPTPAPNGMHNASQQSNPAGAVSQAGSIQHCPNTIRSSSECASGANAGRSHAFPQDPPHESPTTICDEAKDHALPIYVVYGEADSKTAGPSPAIPSNGLYRSILSRDGGVCRYCGAPAACVDHVLPRSLGGETGEGNLVAACTRCNLRKADFGGFYLRFDKRCNGVQRGTLHYRSKAISPCCLFGEALWMYVAADRTEVACKRRRRWAGRRKRGG